MPALRGLSLTRTNLAARTKQQDRGDMDTTRPVVGQDVYMFNDHYPTWFWEQRGKVVKVTRSGLEVEVVDLLRFDTNDIPAFIVGQTPLVVGQDVDVVYSQHKDRKGKTVRVTASGVERDRRGKVVKVTPEGVDVEVVDLLRFDNDGYELDVSRRDRFGFGPSPEDKFYTALWESAPEFAPWHLDDMPFAERTALLEQHARGLLHINSLREIADLNRLAENSEARRRKQEPAKK
jgi:hypothetical protein